MTTSSTIQRPSVGRIVHVYSPNWEGPRAAIITGVEPDSEDRCDVEVFLRQCDTQRHDCPDRVYVNVRQLERGEVPGNAVLWQWPLFVPPAVPVPVNKAEPLTEQDRRDIAEQDSDRDPPASLSDGDGDDNGDA